MNATPTRLQVARPWIRPLSADPGPGPTAAKSGRRKHTTQLTALASNSDPYITRTLNHPVCPQCGHSRAAPSPRQLCYTFSSLHTPPTPLCPPACFPLQEEMKQLEVSVHDTPPPAPHPHPSSRRVIAGFLLAKVDELSRLLRETLPVPSTKRPPISRATGLRRFFFFFLLVFPCPAPTSSTSFLSCVALINTVTCSYLSHHYSSSLFSLNYLPASGLISLLAFPVKFLEFSMLTDAKPTAIRLFVQTIPKKPLLPCTSPTSNCQVLVLILTLPTESTRYSLLLASNLTLLHLSFSSLLISTPAPSPIPKLSPWTFFFFF